jgi:hypothetical protein
MGVPTSEVGYTSVKTRGETTKSIRDMWWYWGAREGELVDGGNSVLSINDMF